MKKIFIGLAVLILSICMLSACGQSGSQSDESGYTIDNIRDYVVGLDEEMAKIVGKEFQELVKSEDELFG